MQTLKKKFEHYKKEEGVANQKILIIKSFYNDCSGQKKGMQNKLLAFFYPYQLFTTVFSNLKVDTIGMWSARPLKLS